MLDDIANPLATPQPAPAKPLRLGTRRSPLAMAQAHEARARLIAAHGWHEAAVDIVPVTASGDKIQDRPLADIGGKALWTKELDVWLAEGEIDFAVHSAKDVETERPDWLCFAAVLPREDLRDCLIGAASLAALPQGARIGTSAPRRAALVRHARPDCVIVPFRGNVATRLERLARGEAEATLLAMAGLNRLGHRDLGVALAAQDWLPAPGQGAIAIEARRHDTATRTALAAINEPHAHATLIAERRLLAALGGNCHSAIGVLSAIAADRQTLTAALFSPDGQTRVDGTADFALNDAAAPARLAASLLARAPLAITRHFAPPHSTPPHSTPARPA